MFTLGDAVRAVRFRHPVFADPATVPTVTLVAEASRLQRSLFEAATRAYSGALATQVPIYLALDSANLPATVAAGTSGGLPVRSRTAPLDVTAGFATHFDLENAAEILGQFVPTSLLIGATTTVVTLSSAARVVNGDVAYYLQIVAGPGFGPDAIRSVNTNGVDSWTVDNFRVDPTLTSVFRLIAVVEQELDTDATVVTQLPSTRPEAAYLIKLDAAGQPYVDLTTPLVATLREGVPLPPHYLLLALEIPRTVPGSFPPDPTIAPVTLQAPFLTIPMHYGKRREGCGATCFIEGDRLYLGGDRFTWTRVTNLILTFVPIPPPFDTTSRTVLDTPFLLPDSASEAITSGLTLVAARQAVARQKVGPEIVTQAAADAASEAGLWIRSLKLRSGALVRQGVRNR